MIGYVTLGTNDLQKAASFYDELLKGLGAKRFFDTETFVAWGASPDKPMISVTKPHDGNAATVGNGVMIALAVKSQEQVKELHAKAMELGAQNEGDPGPRGGGFYCGYFRDLDGNKFNFYCHGAE